MPSAPPEQHPSGIIKDNSGCQNAVGYMIDLSPKSGDAACMLDIGPGHINRNGQLHGGIMSVLLDVACGYAASLFFDRAIIVPVLTLNLNTHYVAPVGAGRVIAFGVATGGGRKICFVTGELRDEADTLVASAAGTFKLIRKPEAR